MRTVLDAVYHYGPFTPALATGAGPAGVSIKTEPEGLPDGGVSGGRDTRGVSLPGSEARGGVAEGRWGSSVWGPEAGVTSPGSAGGSGTATSTSLSAPLPYVPSVLLPSQRCVGAETWRNQVKMMMPKKYLIITSHIKLVR